MYSCNEFCNILINIANNYKTLYVAGGFGAPLNTKNKARYKTSTAMDKYNQSPSVSKNITNASEDTFAFDCVNLIKGILWGWNGDKNKTYGGATYRSNGVPDVGANAMCKTYLKDVSTDFTNIVKGEAVWIDGHIGVYVGNGDVVECTPKWLNKVQITHLGNLAQFKNGNYRVWTKHGKLPWVDYSTTVAINPKPLEPANEKTIVESKKTNEEVAREVIKGKWGNGATRKSKLKEAGYDPLVIQMIVNKLLK